MNNTSQQMAADAARMMNYKKHAEQLAVPILKGLERVDGGNPQTVLIAKGQGLVEQLTSDGRIEEGQFDQRIDAVIAKTKQFMKQNGCENADESFTYREDYSNGIFQFKLYSCDMLMRAGNEKKLIRQLFAYFVEPKMQDFYQLSLSAGPFSAPAAQSDDSQNDQVPTVLNKLMKMLMDNLKYKN